MEKKQLIRWLLDAGVIVVMAVGGFLFGRVDQLQKSSIETSQRVQD